MNALHWMQALLGAVTVLKVVLYFPLDMHIQDEGLAETKDDVEMWPVCVELTPNRVPVSVA